MRRQLLTGATILLILASCKKPDPIYTTIKEVTLEDQLRNYSPTPQTNLANAEEVIRITTEAGNKVNFPSNAFIDASGNPIKGNVEVSITEITNIGDMILSGMMTNSDEGPLSSQGEFNISVAQNGIEVELADGVTFTIENPNETADSSTFGWDWVPGIVSIIDGGEVQSAGFWTRTPFDENNDCDRLENLVKELYFGAPTNYPEYWKQIKEFRDEALIQVDKLESTENQAISLVARLDSTQIACNNINSEWGYYQNSMGGQFPNNTIASGDQAISALNGFGTPDINAVIEGCKITLDNNPPHFMDPNLLVLEFNNLSWCNIDALINQYGSLNNCEIKIEGLGKNTYVKCLFPQFNGATGCSIKEEGIFIANKLPNGMDINFLVYFKDGDSFKCGIQTITAASNMTFDKANLKTLNSLDELVEEIKKLTE